MAEIIISNSQIGPGAFGPVDPIHQPKIPAKCPVHGWVNVPFPFGGAKVWVDRVATNCPICGRQARVADGLHDFTRWVAELAYTAGLTRQQRRRFALKAKKARNSELFSQTVKYIDPNLETVVKKAKNEPKWKEALVVAATVITILATAPTAFSNAKDAADWVVERYELLLSDEVPDNASDEDEQPDNSNNQETKNNPSDNRSTGDDRNWDDVIDT